MSADVLEWADSVGITFDWMDDWACGSHVDEYPDAYDREPSECLGCVVRDAEGNGLASLWCIDDPDRDYIREIEADLALEALEEIGRPGFRDVPMFPALAAIGGAA